MLSTDARKKLDSQMGSSHPATAQAVVFRVLIFVGVLGVDYSINEPLSRFHHFAHGRS